MIDKNITKYFVESSEFKIARQYDNSIVFERFYEKMKYFSPEFNNSTNEFERCIIIFELQGTKNNLIEIAVNIKRHFPSGTDFGHNDITKNNIKSSFEPIELYVLEEICLDEKKGIFYYKNKKISFNKLLNRLYQAHIRPTKRFFGFWLRTKQKLVKFQYDSTEQIISLIESTMKILFGLELIKEELFDELFFKPIKREQIKVRENKLIKIPYGYECSKNEAVLSCIVMILLAVFFRETITENAAIAVIIAIPVWVVILFFIQVLLPVVFLILINGIIIIRNLKIFNSVRV